MLSWSIGPFTLSAQVALGLAFVGLFLLVSKLRSENKAQYSELANLFSSAVMWALLGARLAFVALYWQEYRQNWWGTLDIRDGGFHVGAGIATGLGYAAIRLYSRRHLAGHFALALIIGLVVVMPLQLSLAIVQQGARLPSQVLPDITGSDVALEQFAGKPVVINFWASWCPPCRREMPVLQAAQQDYSQLHVVLINQGERAADIARFVDEQGLQLNNMLLDRDGVVSRSVGASALPTTLFYDAQGKLVASHLGELSKASLRAYLEKLNVE